MASQQNCPYCGANVARTAHYCDQCGTPLEQTASRRRQEKGHAWHWACAFLVLTASFVVSLFLLKPYLPFVSAGAPQAPVHVPEVPTDMVDYEPEVAQETPVDEVPEPQWNDTPLVEAAIPAIVSVTAQGPRGTSTGTGFLYDEGGRVVTSYHVIEGADRIEVVDSHGERHRAHKHQHEANRDLAMLYVPTLVGKAPLQMAPRTGRVELGERVLVFGSPLGPDKPYLTGIVGGVGQQQRCEDRPFYDLITLTAVVAKGNSGGPVIDPVTGQVIGIIVCRTDSAQGLGLSYAIPVRAVSEMLEQWAGLPNPTAIAPVNRPTRTAQVRIGLLGGLTGADEAVAKSLAEGAYLAIREMDPTLAALGYNVDLKLFDTQGRIDMATEMASRVRYDQDVLAVVGTFDADVAPVVMPALRVDGVSVVAPVNTDPFMTRQGWSNYFRLLAADHLQGAAAAKFLAAGSVRTVYVLEESDEYGTAMAASFAAAAREQGMIVVARDIVTDEVAESVGERIAATKPDVVYAGGRAAALAPALKKARDGGFAGTIIGPDRLDDPRLAAEVGEEALFFTSPGRPLSEAFKKLFEKEYKKPATPQAALGYDAARLVLEALERYGKDNPGKVPDRLQLGKMIRENIGFTGWTVTATFDQAGDNLDASVYVYGWHGLEPRLVESYRP